MMPLPLSRLRKIQAAIEEKVYERTRDMVADQEKTPDLMRFIADILKSLDFIDICYRVFADIKDPDTHESVNKDLTKEFFEEYLDTPTLRRCVMTFVEVNELEEVVRNFRLLPGVDKLIEILTTTFGMTLLSSLPLSTSSALGRSQSSPSPSSSDTSQQTTDGSSPSQKSSTVQ